MATSTELWPISDQYTQQASVTVYTTFTTVDVPNTERTAEMDGKRESSLTTTRVTSISTHVLSVSGYNTQLTPTLVRTTAIADVTTQEVSSTISKEPTHGRFLRYISRNKHAQV